MVMTEATLYERLGGEDKIRKIAAAILENHLGNDVVSARFADSDPDEMVRIVTEFICMGTGGPQEYTGKDMLTAHRGMNIGEHEYLAVVDDIMAALASNSVGEREQQEVLWIAYSLKGDIVRV